MWQQRSRLEDYFWRTGRFINWQMQEEEDGRRAMRLFNEELQQRQEEDLEAEGLVSSSSLSLLQMFVEEPHGPPAILLFLHLPIDVMNRPVLQKSSSKRDRCCHISCCCLRSILFQLSSVVSLEQPFGCSKQQPD